MIASSIINYPAQLKSNTSKVCRGKFNNVDIPGIRYYLHEQQKNNNKRNMDDTNKYREWEAK